MVKWFQRQMYTFLIYCLSIFNCDDCYFVTSIPKIYFLYSKLNVPKIYTLLPNMIVIFSFTLRLRYI